MPYVDHNPGDRSSASEAPLFFLDAPQPHQLGSGTPLRIRGAALAVDGPELQSLVIRRDDRPFVEMTINVPCAELASLRLAGASTSRFQADALFRPGPTYEFRGRQRDGMEISLFTLAVDEIALLRIQGIARTVLAMPPPPASLVGTTQGGEDVASYMSSAVSGLLSMERVLALAGVDPERVVRVLDIGCGTGRLLLGWHAANPSRQLVGVDVNPELIAWNRRLLPTLATWQATGLLPPLPFPDASFDLIQLTSVFTHLPLEHQRLWLTELRRLVGSHGVVVVTLHGDLYARLLLDDASREVFAKEGHVEVAGATPGANAFSAFHSPSFARGLFSEFSRVQFFPRGNVGVPSVFPIAALQDVYVLLP